MMRPALSEEELLPLSGLQHLMFCERQAALIHVEKLWADNRLTLEGSHLHRRVDDTGPRREHRGDLLVVRGVWLRSLALGLTGRADVVEFHRADEETSISLDGLPGRWIPYPVDYKRGRPKSGPCDEVQLCAQAMCLEEVLRTRVPEGALFYGQQRRRRVVRFEASIRDVTRRAAARLHEVVRSDTTPSPAWRTACENCSLVDVCMPKVLSRGSSAMDYVDRLAQEVIAEDSEAL